MPMIVENCTEWTSSYGDRYWNKGVGTQLVRQMVSYLTDKKGADRL